MISLVVSKAFLAGRQFLAAASLTGDGRPRDASRDPSLAGLAEVEEADDFADFYARHFKKVLNATFAFDGQYEDALDATQEAFGRALVRWKRLGGAPWAEGWVMTTAFNLCRRRIFRAQKEAKIRSLSKDRSFAPEVADDVASRIDLLRAIKDLPRRRREAAVLYYIGDLSVEAVAQSMQLSQGAVKRHLSLARTQLSEVMKGMS